MADESKVVGRIQRKYHGNETRRAENSNTPLPSDERDPVKLFEQRLEHRPDVLKKSSPLYLTIIPRPTSNTWYSKTRMGQERIRQITEPIASYMPPSPIRSHITQREKPSLPSLRMLVNLVTRLSKSQDMLGNPPWKVKD